jgi:hypothetical protein
MTNSPGGGACVLSVIWFQEGGRRSAEGSVPKLEYDILRRNASTNVRKTYLIERYILHESCHESTFKLIRHHNFNDVLFSVGATWTSTNTIILKSNEHKSYAWVFSVITRRICHIYAIHYNWKRRFWS